MIELSSPKEGDLERQKELWRLAFGDGDGYIEAYYASRYRPEETLVLKEGGVVMSMLAGLPMALCSADGGSFPGAYVYALATHPDGRGQGYGEFLLKYADFRFQEEKKACALVVPAEPSLHGYFARAGFREAFAHWEWEEAYTEGETPTGRIRAAEPAAYNEVRNRLLRGRCHVACDEEAIRLQKVFSRLSGGDIYLLDLPEGQGCAAAERTGTGGVIVKELLVPDGARSSAAALLKKQLPAPIYSFRLPVDQAPPPGAARRAFGMLKWYLAEEKTPACEAGFLGLAYD